MRKPLRARIRSRERRPEFARIPAGVSGHSGQWALCCRRLEAVRHHRVPPQNRATTRRCDESAAAAGRATVATARSRQACGWLRSRRRMRKPLRARIRSREQRPEFARIPAGVSGQCKPSVVVCSPPGNLPAIKWRDCKTTPHPAAVTSQPLRRDAPPLRPLAPASLRLAPLAALNPQAAARLGSEPRTEDGIRQNSGRSERSRHAMGALPSRPGGSPLPPGASAKPRLNPPL
jgi:hypothetical protein